MVSKKISSKIKSNKKRKVIKTTKKKQVKVKLFSRLKNKFKDLIKCVSVKISKALISLVNKIQQFIKFIFCLSKRIFLLIKTKCLEVAKSKKTQKNISFFKERFLFYKTKFLKKAKPFLDKVDPYFQKAKTEVNFILDKKLEKEEFNISRKPIILGVWTVMGILLFFGFWGCTADIDSAAIAPGTVVLDSNRKTIQHLEGGIINEIFVENGQEIKSGQILIKLDEISAKAGFEVLKKQMFSLQATKKRLEIERDREVRSDNLEEREVMTEEVITLDVVEEKDKIDVKSEEKNEIKLLFTEKVFELNNNKELLKILEGEQKLFNTRYKAISGQINILYQRIEQSKKQIEGLQSQESSTTNRIKFVKDEIASAYQLYKQDIISKTDYLNLKKQLAELEGNKGEYISSISRAEQAIGETEMEIINTKTQWLNTIIEELQEVQARIADLSERITASGDILIRTTIVAPQSGIITDLKFYTKGGVIPPNAPVMDIIPQDDDLVIEAKVNPQDIDVVHKGLSAKIRLSAYKQKKVPMLNSKVLYVSADSFQDQMTGLSFYKAKIEINKDELKKLKDVKLYPGMPAEVYIVTGSRTFFQYLFSPISDSMRRAFKEE